MSETVTPDREMSERERLINLIVQFSDETADKAADAIISDGYTRAQPVAANDRIVEIVRLRGENIELVNRYNILLGEMAKAENSNAIRMRAAIVEARRHLAKGKALWSGPCHLCDAVLEQALRADNDAEAIASATATEPPR